MTNEDNYLLYLSIKNMFLTEQLFRDDSLAPNAWFPYSSRITGDIFYL